MLIRVTEPLELIIENFLSRIFLYFSDWVSGPTAPGRLYLLQYTNVSIAIPLRLTVKIEAKKAKILD